MNLKQICRRLNNDLKTILTDVFPLEMMLLYSEKELSH